MADKPKITIRTKRHGEDNPKLKQLFDDGDIMRIELSLVRRDEGQPRSLDNVMENIAELAENISSVGMIEVPCYRISDDGTYVIVTGERRTAAARHLGWTDILARVKRFNPEDVRKLRKIQYFENDPRFKKHLTPIEDALFWRKFVDESFAGSVAEAAADMGVSAALVHNKLAILKANVELTSFIHDHISDSSVASELVTIHKDAPEKAQEWMGDLLSGKLTNVRGSIKNLKKEARGNKSKQTAIKQNDHDLQQKQPEINQQTASVNRTKLVEPVVVTTQGINKVVLDEKTLLSLVAIGDFQGKYLGGAFLSVVERTPFELTLADIPKLDDNAYQLFYQILSLSENIAGQQDIFKPLIEKISFLTNVKS